jgi:hypothetical protein
MKERERDNDHFPLEFKEKEKKSTRTKSMKVTSTIEKCIFVPMAEKRELMVMATGFSLTKTNIFCSQTLFLF